MYANRSVNSGPHGRTIGVFMVDFLIGRTTGVFTVDFLFGRTMSVLILDPLYAHGSEGLFLYDIDNGSVNHVDCG